MCYLYRTEGLAEGGEERPNPNPNPNPNPDWKVWQREERRRRLSIHRPSKEKIESEIEHLRYSLSFFRWYSGPSGGILRVFFVTGAGIEKVNGFYLHTVVHDSEAGILEHSYINVHSVQLKQWKRNEGGEMNWTFFDVETPCYTTETAGKEPPTGPGHFRPEFTFTGFPIIQELDIDVPENEAALVKRHVYLFSLETSILSEVELQQALHVVGEERRSTLNPIEIGDIEQFEPWGEGSREDLAKKLLDRKFDIYQKRLKEVQRLNMEIRCKHVNKDTMRMAPAVRLMMSHKSTKKSFLSEGSSRLGVLYVRPYMHIVNNSEAQLVKKWRSLSVDGDDDVTKDPSGLDTFKEYQDIYTMTVPCHDTSEVGREAIHKLTP